jgi:hypothetical protein
MSTLKPSRTLLSSQVAIEKVLCEFRNTHWRGASAPPPITVVDRETATGYGPEYSLPFIAKECNPDWSIDWSLNLRLNHKSNMARVTLHEGFSTSEEGVACIKDTPAIVVSSDVMASCEFRIEEFPRNCTAFRNLVLKMQGEIAATNALLVSNTEESD